MYQRINISSAENVVCKKTEPKANDSRKYWTVEILLGYGRPLLPKRHMRRIYFPDPITGGYEDQRKV
jgi:hypothetical protein